MVTRDIVVEDVLYYTVSCDVYIAYDEGKKEIEDIYLVSNFHYTKQSSLQGTDIGQYGGCDHNKK
ncbi:MAG: hypothetical protein ACI4EF_00055 [Coprococcus sp.]